MKLSKVFIIIPAYNEEKRIGDAVKKTKKHVKNIIVVDDGSKDKTSEAAKKAGAKVLTFKMNRGKGFAQRTGAKEAITNGAEIIIFIDANQHNPDDIPRFLEALKNCDMVIGSRKLGVMKTTFINKIGNFGLTLGTNLLSFGLHFNKWLTDTESGYRAIKVEKYKLLRLISMRYEIESEMILEAARNQLKIKEISIKTTKKITERGLGVNVQGGLRNAMYIFERKLLG